MVVKVFKNPFIEYFILWRWSNVVLQNCSLIPKLSSGKCLPFNSQLTLFFNSHPHLVQIFSTWLVLININFYFGFRSILFDKNWSNHLQCTNIIFQIICFFLSWMSNCNPIDDYLKSMLFDSFFDPQAFVHKSRPIKLSTFHAYTSMW